MPPKHHREHNWEDSAPWLVNDDEVAVLTGEIACNNPFNAYLIAAAPCMAEYIRRKAGEGCAEAARLLAKAEGRS
jgi:hypothetical protein